MATLPRIDGTDELSQRALAMLRQGKPPSALEALGLTRDQAKKLSRLLTLHLAADLHLPGGAQEKLRALGLKALALAPLARAEDWTGLEEVLQSVDPATVKRQELEQAPALLAEKRTRVADVERQLRGRLEELERQQERLRAEEERLTELQAALEEALALLLPYPPEVRDFLAEHLGIAPDGRLCLSRRLDHAWQIRLKERGALRYDEEQFIWYVEDLDAIAVDVERRQKRGYRLRYDPQHTRYAYDPPKEARYQTPTGLAEDLREAHRRQQERLAEIRREMEAAEREIREIRRRSPQSFLEAVQAANTLSARDLETHGRLQVAALRWLYDQDYVATAELVVGARRWDVAGYDQAGRITIIEVKATVDDFRRDDKWTEYLAYADRFYFVATEAVGRRIRQEIEESGVGLLLVDGQGRIQVARECKVQLEARDREATRWAISRALAKRVVFGF